MGIHSSHPPGSEDHTVSPHRARQPPAPQCAKAISHSHGRNSSHTEDTNSSSSGCIRSRPHQGQNHPTTQQWQHFSHPCRGTTMRPRAGTATPGPVQVLGPSPTCTEGCTTSHLGGHHCTKVATSLLTPVPEKPRCLCQTHAAHARVTGVTIPTLVPGAPQSSHLPWARVAAAPPPADPSGRPPRAPDTARPAAPLAPHECPRPPLPPARSRARPAAAAAATATSILGSPRPRFTNAASAGRRRRRESRLRPPGDAASFT